MPMQKWPSPCTKICLLKMKERPLQPSIWLSLGQVQVDLRFIFCGVCIGYVTWREFRTKLFATENEGVIRLCCRSPDRVDRGLAGGTVKGVGGDAVPRFVALDGRNHLILETEPAWSRFLDEVKSFLGSADPTGS